MDITFNIFVMRYVIFFQNNSNHNFFYRGSQLFISRATLMLVYNFSSTILVTWYLQDASELSPLNHPARELAFSWLFTGLISFPFWFVPCSMVIILLSVVFSLMNFSLDIFIRLDMSSSSAPHPQ